ncbi:MAG: hypothetical protein OEZ06_21275 [Myxococcales bacterium]|nr:hypothetical protein [Myxococcales bacterium]
MDQFDPTSEQGECARLQLDGLATPVVTRVSERRATGITVEQTLPFLRLNTAVLDQAEQRSRIESVSIVVSGGVPRLVLDLAYEEQGLPESAAGGFETEVAGQRRSTHEGVVRPRARAVEQTLSYTETPAELPAVAAYVPEGEARTDSTQLFRTEQAASDGERAEAQVEEGSLEEQLLQARPAYRLAQRWLWLKPRLRLVARQAASLGLQALGYCWPKLVAVVRWSAASGLRLLQAARDRHVRAR